MSHQSPHDKVADAVHEGRPVEARYVRQGRSGVRILILLIVSAAAAAVLLLGLWAVTNGRFASLEPSRAEKAAAAQAFDEGGAAPTADAPTTATGEPAAPAPGTTPNVNATTTRP
ncbi:hypothetical protein [Brevundimonas sp. FT23028]|uniref:hypothetical protein n=1 Tax=Brevundimonas sp. FT23028 TaxID=3393748 RepID=UPI003B58B2ED